MIAAKICMLGGTGVGKTSLVRRCVHRIFSEEYHSTVGVKIDKHTVHHDGSEVGLLVWDLHGEEKHNKVMVSYFKGMSGYVLVVDASRPETISEARALYERAKTVVPNVPYILAVNKSDLVDNWSEFSEKADFLCEHSVGVVKTSAKSGAGVETVFDMLSNEILNSADEKRAG